MRPLYSNGATSFRAACPCPQRARVQRPFFISTCIRKRGFDCKTAWPHMVPSKFILSAFDRRFAEEVEMVQGPERISR